MLDSQPKPQWIIRLLILQHLLWGTMTLFSDQARGVTSIAAVSKLLGDNVLEGVCFLAVAVMAGVSLYLDRRCPTPAGLVLILPQQFVLIASAVGSVSCVVQGHYADGTVAPRVHLLADQSIYLLSGLLHTCAVLSRYTNWRKT